MPFIGYLRREYRVICSFFKKLTHNQSVSDWRRIMIKKSFLVHEDKNKDERIILYIRDFWDSAYTLWWAEIVTDIRSPVKAPLYITRSDLPEKESEFLTERSFRSRLWYHDNVLIPSQIKNYVDHVKKNIQNYRNPKVYVKDQVSKENKIILRKKIRDYLHQLKILTSITNVKLADDWQMQELCNYDDFLVPVFRICRCVFDSTCKTEKKNEGVFFGFMQRYTDLTLISFFFSPDLQKFLKTCADVQDPKEREKKFQRVMYVHIAQDGRFNGIKPETLEDETDTEDEANQYTLFGRPDLQEEANAGMVCYRFQTDGHTSLLVLYPWTLQVGFFDPHGDKNCIYPNKNNSLFR